MTEREFNRHIEKIRPRLIAFAASFMNGGAATAEDMVQDAVTKVWSQRDRVENLDALTTVTLRNVCLDYLRLRKNRTEERTELNSATAFANANTDPQHNLELSDQINNVRKIMAQLPDDQQMVLKLRDVMGYEFEEIARILDMAEGNVRVLLCRARKQVRETMLHNK